MDYLLDDDIYTNDVEYFFSLHGPRFEHMNKAMSISLSNKYGKEYRPIRILNAWPGTDYKSPNYIVLNEMGYRLAKKMKKPVVFLPDYEEVNAEFSQSSLIVEIAERLKEKQKTIFVYPFTTSFLDLPAHMFTVLGPNSELTKYLDNKINQFKLFKKLNLPCNTARIFETEQNLLAHEKEVVPCYISATYTSGGNESGLIYSSEMLHEFLEQLRPINKTSSFVVADIFENIVLAPNVNALTTSDGKVFTLVLSDQILQGNRYLGNIYPSEVSETNKKKICAITNKIGMYLADQGYRGLFGCDFLINKSGELIVVDLNPRHQGGYGCNGLYLSKQGISLTDAELSVFLDEATPVTQQEIDNHQDFAWLHRKIVPYEKGQEIHQELHKNSIEEPFDSIGSSFITEFYEQGSIFIDGYVGYQVHTAKKRDDLGPRASYYKELFDAEVFGL